MDNKIYSETSNIDHDQNNYTIKNSDLNLTNGSYIIMITPENKKMFETIQIVEKH